MDLLKVRWSPDMADYLALKGVPFREAHEITGKTVALCIKKGKALEELSLKELKEISSKFDKNIFDYISVERSVQRKDVYGGTAKKRALEQIARLQKQIAKSK